MTCPPYPDRLSDQCGFHSNICMFNPTPII